MSRTVAYPRFNVNSGAMQLGDLILGSGLIASGSIVGFGPGGFPKPIDHVERWIRSCTPMIPETPAEIVADWCEDKGWQPMADYMMAKSDGS